MEPVYFNPSAFGWDVVFWRERLGRPVLFEAPLLVVPTDAEILKEALDLVAEVEARLNPKE